MPRPFSWWWPSSNAGNAAFWVVLAISSLTFLIAGPFAIINVAFWYAVAVGARFVGLHALGRVPSPPKSPTGTA